jgi:PIN domain nuclease of toxin-antitoxin system
MNLLLDTHVLLWWTEDSKRLGPRTRKTIERPDTSVWISVVSVWEIAIKTSAGRLKIRQPLEETIDDLVGAGFQSLPVNMEHALAAGKLPPLHEDPFDRMLVAQAQCEGLTVVTVDSAVEAYDVRTLDASE